MARLCLIVIAGLITTVAFAADYPVPFPRPPELEPDVRFWTRVYSEVDTDSGFIHDPRNLNVVYEVIRFPSELNETARGQRIKEAKRRYRNILFTLARGNREGLTEDEQNVLALWPENVSHRMLRAAASRLRFQLGQADRFRDGLVRSGAWEPFIRKTLIDMGLPRELVVLPHVESSYDPSAYSRVGAAGLWQLTRSTGRRYLRVNTVVDERLDPYMATVAAARVLKHNHTVTGSWPLAITAYNHGAAGMRRAVRKLGTRDIVTVVRKYRSRTFRFASRNFYPAFLAAVDVHFNAEEYFGTLHRDNPEETELVKIPAYVTVGTLQRVLDIDHSTLRRNNPALRRAVWRGTKYIPGGYKLRVPQGAMREPAENIFARIKASERFHAQLRDRLYKVRPGNTLSDIATRFRVSVDALVAINRLRDRHHLSTGQVLRLPPSGRDSAAILASTQLERADPPANGHYRVRPGDSLSVIALRFGVSEQALVVANQLSDRDRLDAGQILRVVTVSSATTEAPADSSRENFDVDVNSAAAEPESAVATVESPGPEPASVIEGETYGATLSQQDRPELSEDPSDYTVAGESSIEVQAAETLGHYAEWLELRTDHLRRLNRLRYKQPVVVGRRLRLDFSRVSSEAFEQRRIAYHRSLQREFFTQNRITGTHDHIVRRGESVWVLLQRDYNVPLWLIRQYNPDLDLRAVLPGTTIKIPLVKALDESISDPESEHGQA